MGFEDEAARIALWIAAAMVVVAVVGAFLRQRRMAIGFAVVAVLAVAASVVVTRLEQVDSIWVVGFHDLDPSFSVEVRNVPLEKSGATYTFRYGGGWDALVDDLEASHPEGETDGDAWSAVGADGVRYRVVAGDPSGTFEGDDVYVLSTDTITLWRDANEVAYAIPFPPVGPVGPNLLSNDVTDYRWHVDGVVTESELAGYYDALGGVKRDGDAFIVPTSTGDLARVWFVNPLSLSFADASS